MTLRAREMEETVLKILELFSEGLIDDVLGKVNQSPQVEMEARTNLIAKKNNTSPRFVTDAGRDPFRYIPA